MLADVQMLAALLWLPLLMSPTAPDVVRIAPSRVYALSKLVLDASFVDHERILLLTPSSVVLARIGKSSLTPLSEQALPEPTRVVRRVAGWLLPSEDRSSAWILTNITPIASLVAIEDERVLVRSEANAVPWHGSQSGIIFREGTDWLEATIDRLGEGPFLRLAPINEGLAVTVDGRVRIANANGGRLLEDVRIGPTVTPLWSGLLVASSNQPPGSSDALLVLEPSGSEYRVAESVPVEGAVRALSSYVQATRAHVAAVIEKEDGSRALHLYVFSRASEQ
jgi:hypothetical protein